LIDSAGYWDLGREVVARQMKQQPKRDAIDGRPQAGQPTEEFKRRPTVEELMAMSSEDFEAWWRSLGGKTGSDLGISVE
jgi:hypothetical protein